MPPMNEAIQTALASALTAAQEALAAAQAGRFDEARSLLVIMDEHLEQGRGGNAAHAARRRKVLRLEADVRALLPQEEAAASAPQPGPPHEVEEAPASQPLAAPTLPGTAPLSVTQARQRPAQVEAVAKAARRVAPPQHLSAEAWARIGAALSAGGLDAATREADLPALEQTLAEARAARDTYRAKTAECALLQARVEVAALRGDVGAANAAWDRLFDVVTAIRGFEGKARRAGTPDPQKAADYEAARLYRLRIGQWGRGVHAA